VTADLFLHSSERIIYISCQILSEKCIKKIKKVNAIANIQPSFLLSDVSLLPLISEKCRNFSYCWKRLLDSGCNVSGGSDAPVDKLSPFCIM
jgi:predicted amidohydrolase YtcJ